MKKAEIRRAEILQAALRCFLEKGIEATTVQDVRQRSGASIGSIYHAFSSKDAMAAELYVGAFIDWHTGLFKAVEAKKKAEDVIRGVVTYDIDWVTGSPDLARFVLFSRKTQFDSETQKTIHGEERVFLQAFKRRLALLAKEVRALPIDSTYAIVLGPCTEWAKQWLGGTSLTKPAEARRIFGDAAWASVRG